MIHSLALLRAQFFKPLRGLLLLTSHAAFLERFPHALSLPLSVHARSRPVHVTHRCPTLLAFTLLASLQHIVKVLYQGLHLTLGHLLRVVMQQVDQDGLDIFDLASFD